MNSWAPGAGEPSLRDVEHWRTVLCGDMAHPEPWTMGINHPPPHHNPFQNESLPSPASAPSGAPTNLIILNLLLFSRSSI